MFLYIPIDPNRFFTLDPMTSFHVPQFYLRGAQIRIGCLELDLSSCTSCALRADTVNKFDQVYHDNEGL